MKVKTFGANFTFIIVFTNWRKIANSCVKNQTYTKKEKKHQTCIIQFFNIKINTPTSNRADQHLSIDVYNLIKPTQPRNFTWNLAKGSPTPSFSDSGFRFAHLFKSQWLSDHMGEGGEVKKKNKSKLNPFDTKLKLAKKTLKVDYIVEYISSIHIEERCRIYGTHTRACVRARVRWLATDLPRTLLGRDPGWWFYKRQNWLPPKKDFQKCD